MATWKKVVISGSDISQLNNNLEYIENGQDGVILTGSFTGSFDGEFTGILADGTTATTQTTGDNSTKVATTAYVDAVATAADLNITGSGDTTTDIDLDSQSLTFVGNDGLQLSASAQTITATIADASITGTKISGGTVTNDNLENDSVFIGDQTIELGAAATTTLSGLTVSGSFSGSFEGDGSGLTGILSGTGVDNQVATWSGTDSIDGSANFTYDGTTLTVGSKATIGTNNLNTGVLSTIAGGTLNTASAECSFIGGGENNSITGCELGNIVGGQNNTISGGYNGFIGAGNGNTLSAGYGCENVIVGGCNNDITAACGAERNFIGGGSNNTISGDYTTNSGILGGTSNCINVHDNSFIIGSNLTSSADCTTYVNNLDVEGSITGSSFTGSFVGDGSGLTGVDASSLTNALTAGTGVDFDAGTTFDGSVARILNLDLTEVISTDGANKILTSDGDGTLTAEPNFTFDGTDLTVTGNQLVTGDLTVQGTASFQHTEEYQVADRFILMASGSSTAGDGGIVIQQGTQNVGEVFGFDSGTTRFGLTGSFDASATAFTPDAFMAAVVNTAGNDPNGVNAPDTRYEKKGNLYVANDSEDIWIYS